MIEQMQCRVITVEIRNGDQREGLRLAPAVCQIYTRITKLGVSQWPQPTGRLRAICKYRSTSH